MQEAEEQDTCRICSAPEEPDQPLFHPCKCSGTIRYIHQDCLTTWLAHSKKKTCDVCKHPYAFTKVYAPNMPSTLPPVLLLKRLIETMLFGLLFVMRAVAVAAIWLGVLPWVTVWTWRMYFSMGESTAWWISDRPRPPSTENSSSSFFYTKIRFDGTVPPPGNFITRITTHPVWLALSADIFTGQIIASLIVLTFVAVFLLREWIAQNARPGVFEEEEILPPADPPPVQLQEPQPEPQPQVVHEDDFPEPDVQRQADAMQAGNPIQRQNVDPEVALNPDRWFQDDDEGSRRNIKKQKARQLDDNDGEEGEVDQRRKLHDDHVQEVEGFRRKQFHRRIHVAKAVGAHRRNFYRPQKPHFPPPLQRNVPVEAEGQQKFDFTFKPDQNLADPQGPSSSHISSPPTSSNMPFTFNSANDTSPFPTVALQPPSSAIPFSLRSPLAESSIPPQPYPARPSLPSYTLDARSGSESPFAYSPAKAPLETPSLATYRAPEELGPIAGPSSLPPDYSELEPIEQRAEDEADYDGHPNDDDGEWDNVDSDEDVDMEAEHDKYFREHGDVDIEVERERYLREVARVEDRDVPQQERMRIQIAVDSETEDETDEGEGEEEIQNDGDHDDDEDNIRDIEEDEEEDDGPWPEEDDEDAQVMPDDQAGQGAQAAGEAGPADGLDEEPNLDPNDMAENVEDDMDGAMEAIGMRGPVYAVVQNAALMIFVLDTAIGLGVWIPFTIGKTAALLSLDPHRLFQVMHLPLRATRIVTDPFVDFFVFLFVEIFIPWLTSAIRTVFQVVFFSTLYFVRILLGKGVATWISNFSSRVYHKSVDLVCEPLAEFVSSWANPSNATEFILLTEDTVLSTTSSIPDYLGFTEPYFELLGKEVRLTGVKLQTTWIRMALGSGTSSRVFAIGLGYAVVSLLFCLYLNILTVGNARTAGLAVRNAVRQQLLVLKVAAFIFIELVTFPLGCGIVLDLSTVWLFPEANLQSRLAFFSQAPLTAMFYHWVAGTMFMYSFALLLSGCRSVMRPGAMWFIKDPQDQNSHPIRDILDRPTLTQLRKICISGLMYSFVVVCVVGSVAGLLVVGSKSIMPFRWKNREPLSNVPVDLLFLHLVLPYTMQYFRPKKVVKDVAASVWKFLATRLRLTSYFFGGRHPREEVTPKNWQDNFIREGFHTVNEGDISNGSFRRVPAVDNVALPRDMRATVSVNAEGEPVDDEAKELMALQNAEADKAKRNVKVDFMIVYIPPHFRHRIICFIALLWMFGSVMLGLSVALPITLGRSFFRLFTSRDIHDGYSFIVGFYLVWMCYLIGKAVDRLDKRRQRRNGDAPRANLHVLVLKRGLLWVAKTLYMVFFLGVIIPVLLAVVIDLYVILPVRLEWDPTMTPRIRVVDAWALGLLYAKIAMYAHRIEPPNRITRGLQHILAHGWTRPDPITATKEVIAPLGGGLLAMIIFPGAVFRAMQHFFPNLVLDNRFIFMHVYPMVFVLAATAHAAIILYNVLRSWSQSIRDKEFLVELRLKNHDPDEVLEPPKERSRRRRLVPRDPAQRAAFRAAQRGAMRQRQLQNARLPNQRLG